MISHFENQLDVIETKFYCQDSGGPLLEVKIVRNPKADLSCRLSCNSSRLSPGWSVGQWFMFKCLDNWSYYGHLIFKTMGMRAR